MPGMAFRRGGLVEPGVTSTYLYDSSGQRIYSKDVTMSSEGAILETRETYTISKNYSETYVNGVLKTKNAHIFAGDLMLATKEDETVPPGQGGMPAGQGGLMKYHLADHLGSTNISTDSTGAIVELSDYFSYGSPRQSIQSGTSPEKRKYIGQEYDTSTGLNYLNARYYNSAIGRFISQDPVFWGDQNLLNPQSLNSYSYANNNPVVYSDTTGLWAQLIPIVMDLMPAILSFGAFLTSNLGSAWGSQAIDDPISVTPVGAAQQIVNAAYGTSSTGVPLSTGERIQEGVFGVIGAVAPLTELKEGSTKPTTAKAAVAETPKVVATTAKTAPTVNNSPDIIVDPGGQAFPVPKGAKGPTPSINSAGKKTGVQFTGGSGGANGKVATMRIVDPVPAIGRSPAYPNGYIKYYNNATPKPQGVNPYTGRTGANSETHYPICSRSQ